MDLRPSRRGVVGLISGTPAFLVSFSTPAFSSEESYEGLALVVSVILVSLLLWSVTPVLLVGPPPVLLACFFLGCTPF